MRSGALPARLEELLSFESDPANLICISSDLSHPHPLVARTAKAAAAHRSALVRSRERLFAFVGIDLAPESAPDATTLLKFRHLLETKELTRPIFDAVNGHLAEKSLMMRGGTIVDVTLIASAPSTKNKDGKRDPKMLQSTEE